MVAAALNYRGGTRRSGFRVTFEPDFTRYRGARLTTDLALIQKGELPEEAAALVRNAVVRWVKFLNAKTIPTVVRRVLNVRSGTLATAKAMMAAPRKSSEGAGVTDFSITVSLPGQSAKYGGVQEYGREEGAGPKAKYYMVPLSRQWGRNKVWNSETLKKELSRKGLFWIPRGEGNYMQDKAGRDVKFVFQMDPRLADKYKKGKFGRGMIKSRQAIINKAEREKQKAQGKSLSRGEELRSWAKLLFLAYPDTVTSIPGVSSYARTQGNKVSNKGRMAQAGIGGNRIRGRGPGEASRWWSRSLVEAAPELEKYMTDPKFTRAIRAAIESSLVLLAGQSTGGRQTPLRKIRL